MTLQMPRPFIEWLILADAAQVVGNKLYLMGAGWDSINANNGFPFEHHMAVAISILVPWTEADKRHAFEIEIATEDGKSLAKIGGQMEAGPPQGSRPGAARRSQVALGVTLKLDKAGGYVVAGSVDGGPQSVYPFHVQGPPAGVSG
jgi:hypothetical protein